MPQTHDRRVKIVCTLGPASSSYEKISELIESGLNVARLNFSHGSHNDHERNFRSVRRAAKKQARLVAVLQDLQGPKIRLGKIPAPGIQISAGEKWVLHEEGVSPYQLKANGARLIPINAEIARPIAASVVKGKRVLFDDGKCAGVVLRNGANWIEIEITVGGLLTSNKGMNLPGSPLPIPSMTEKDWTDLKFGLELGVDMIALSFVRSADDLTKVRAFIAKNSRNRPLLISKIEREEAVLDLEAVIAASDGVLIARGDMAVELGAEHVPVIQKRCIQLCNHFGKPVITATQMLESMIEHVTPTRAEANDVANAVFDGTDAVMLSGETASGKHPVEAVKVMQKIIQEAEKNIAAFSRHKEQLPVRGSVVDSIAFSASRIANHVDARCIACLTHTGKAALTLSRFRPERPIIAVMDREENLRKLALVWGIEGILIPQIVSTDDVFRMMEKALLKHDLVVSGDSVVITAGVPTLRRGTTNMIKVHKIS